MSDALPPDVASSTPPMRRPWTILGRLSAAVREQNWFAVALEVVIVVVGVVIGFQVTAWGQDRADRAKEQAYLRQLAEDLRETEQHIATVNDWLAVFEEGTGALQRSFYEPTRPSADTLISRIYRSGGYWKVNATTSTAEALVATGDLSLLRSDSLRSAITDYLRVVDYEEEMQSMILQMSFRDTAPLTSGRGLSRDWELILEQHGLLSETDLLYPFPEGPRRSTSLLDPEVFLSDPAMEKAAFANVLSRMDIRGSRERLLDATVALLERVEAELTR